MPSTAASCVPMTACMHANLPVREWFVQLDNVSIQYSISYNSLCLHDSFHASRVSALLYGAQVCWTLLTGIA